MTEQIEVKITGFFNEVFTGNKFYFMPKYQRPYSWEAKQLEDFWNDMVFALEQNRDLPYLMGSIYLAEVDREQLSGQVNEHVLTKASTVLPYGDDAKYYLVIDGQQRITTFFLFLLSFQEPSINDYLLATGIPRLFPGKIDFDFFVQLVKKENPLSLTKSNKRIEFCLKFFSEEIARFKFRNDLSDFVLANLQIVRINIKKNLEMSTTLFVSQTDRGKRLTNLEKLKSLLMFYSQKIDKTPEEDSSIDNLFGGLFERIESLCSSRIYSKPEQAEADVMRILNFFLLKDNFYRTYLNDLTEDKDRKVEIWHESGEDRIFEAISKVFRESLVIKKENIREIIFCLTEKIRSIYDFFEYLVSCQRDKECKRLYKDFYEGRTWYPIKQLFSVLGLSVYSKALMVDLHRIGKSNMKDPFDNSYALSKNVECVNLNIFEKIDEIKNLYNKLTALNEPSMETNWQDIKEIRQFDVIRVFLSEKLAKTMRNIEKFKQYAAKDLSPINLLEENELSIWKINKRPVSNFLWPDENLEKVLEHIRNFSFEYKKSYLVRDLSYTNYKYVLFEYERLSQNYTDKELDDIFNFDIDEDDGIQIQREHIFSQNPEDHQELKDLLLKTTNENYDDWIWKIGNISLLEHNINIAGAGNKKVWEKALAYRGSCFKGTQSLAEDILKLKELSALANITDNTLNLSLKLFFEIRGMELLAFTFYRFS